MHVTLEQRQITRLRLRQQQIQKPPPRARRAFDELQIFRAKNHRAQRAEIIRQFFHRLAVQREFPFARGPIHFDFMVALPDDVAADEITFRAVPDHLRAADAAKRAQRGHEINRFEDVGLALRVVAEQQMEAGRKIRVQPRVIAEVPESQMGQMHAHKMNFSHRCVREFMKHGFISKLHSRAGKMFSWRMVPCVIFEDEHLLVVNKPAGWNTHAPSPYAGEGIYDWLKHREPRWASLAIIHRLDKETSGVLVFGKTPLANKSLTEQFTERRVRKKYLLLTDRAVPQKEFTVKTSLVRVGEKYASRAGGEMAETKFTPIVGCQIRGQKRRIENGERRAAHRPHAPNPRSRGGKRLSDSRRHALRRHGIVARFFARGGNCVHASGHERAGEIFCAGRILMSNRASLCALPSSSRKRQTPFA